MNNWMQTLRIRAEEDYKNGRRITIDDCIYVTLESLAIHIDGLRKTPLKKYFMNMIETDKIELKDLFEIKKLQNERQKNELEK